MTRRLNRLRWRWLFLRNRARMALLAALDPALQERRRRFRQIHRELWGMHGYQYKRFINPKERDQ